MRSLIIAGADPTFQGDDSWSDAVPGKACAITGQPGSPLAVARSRGHTDLVKLMLGAEGVAERVRRVRRFGSIASPKSDDSVLGKASICTVRVGLSHFCMLWSNIVLARAR